MTETAWMRLTAPELREAALADALVILPVASIEQHGPHLATGTDTFLGGAVAEATAQKLAAAGERVVVLPVMWHGLAEHHMAFGGTITLDQPTFLAVLKGIARSVARHGFKRLMLLNAHGGNTDAIAVAVTEIGVETGLKVAGGTYWYIAPEVIGPILEDQEGLNHACEAETSMMLHVTTGTMREAELPNAHGPKTSRPAIQPKGLAMQRSFRAITPSGVIGDARRASAEKGEKLLAAISTRLADILGDRALWS
ncbi:creatininase family protein [Rhodovarius crocodyli]|uniref:Creatininase family protein n=1 Tax=Rhodovarius crocodyli TaxID=1979269 RepID=A0A437M1E3_9PROT|nr:creatininase family protein [Rhodovarius crocodyli]RVT91530.1 creatininase family protein [Rhodovarius crocodyli]